MSALVDVPALHRFVAVRVRAYQLDGNVAHLAAAWRAARASRLVLPDVLLAALDDALCRATVRGRTRRAAFSVRDVELLDALGALSGLEHLPPRLPATLRSQLGGRFGLSAAAVGEAMAKLRRRLKRRGLAPRCAVLEAFK